MFDLTPLYRSTVGFDHLAQLLGDLGDVEAPSYPPYNIEATASDEYRITMAVAGFSESDLEIETKENTLTISGRQNRQEPENSRNYLHRGIANRSFTRRFRLADHVEVTGAALENGLLHVMLRREVPEAMKPRSIPISASASGKALEGQMA